MVSKYLTDIVKKQKNGFPAGIVSVCTANRFAIKAAMKQALKHKVPVLIEATANQVDQNGGYTGMTPVVFASFVQEIAGEISFPWDMVILGGDHLGPLTRANLDENEAMAYSEELVREYVRAGFAKLHLDTSMRLASDPADRPLSTSIIAERGARSCAASEDAFIKLKAGAPDSVPLLYVIGSEVPIPGGTLSSEDVAEVTSVEQCSETYEIYKQVFEKNGLGEAFTRVLAIVVQTGAEFGDVNVFEYSSGKAKALTDFGRDNLPFVFEGHSTDFQPEESLRSMVRDGIAFLKVGPALTFAFREAFFSLELIEKELYSGTSWTASNFREVLELAMLNHPESWQNHYHGDAAMQSFSRKFSFSDRARYYLNEPTVENSINCLLHNINNTDIPMSLISQYMPLELDYLICRKSEYTAEDLIYAHIGFYLDNYYRAVLPQVL